MKLNNEIKIGIMVLLTIGLLVVLTVKAGNFQGVSKGYNIKVHFRHIDGVELNAPVRVNGLEMGVVKDIHIVYDKATKMELVLWLKEEAKLRQGAKAYIKNMGLMGEKFVELSAGDEGAPFLKEGALILGQDPVDFEKLLAKGEVIASNLEEITDNLNERLKVNSQAIDEIVANINVASVNIASVSENVNERLSINSRAIDDIVSNLNTTSVNLVELSEDLKENPWKLLYKEKKKKVRKQRKTDKKL